MGRLKTCKVCGQKIQLSDTFLPFQTGYAHEKCFETWSKVALNAKNKQIKEKNKRPSKTVKVKEVRDKLTDEEYADKVRYYEYLRELLDTESIAPKARKLSEDYRNKYNATYKDLYDTLVYLKEISTVNLTGDVVGLIPYTLREAKDYFNELHRIEVANRVETKNMFKTKKIIVKSQRRKNNQYDITKE